MVRDRHSAPRRPPPGKSPIDQVAGLIEGFRAEVKGDLDRLSDHVQQSENRAELGFKALDESLSREVAHLNDRIDRFHDAAQRGIEQVRQELRDHERLSAEGAARGAATGAATALQPAVREAVASAPKTFFNSWKAWVITIGAAVAGLGATIDNTPKILRWLEGLWAFLRGPH